jgi:16S rRNA C1402 (ribose-2'-O) methylase RsmI
MENKFIEILAYTIPSIITGSVAYYLFKSYFKDQQNTRRWLLQKEAQKDSLPIRLEAYERMTLFLERINIVKFVVRVTPISENKNDYENYLIAQIEQEFEHNLTQQIYISNECWTMILTAKNATIQMIRVANRSEKINNADKLREVILNEMMDKQSPSLVALEYIKNEVGMLW